MCCHCLAMLNGGRVAGRWEALPSQAELARPWSRGQACLCWQREKLARRSV